MSCVTLTKSRKLACNGGLPGIQAVTVGVFNSLNKVAKTGAGVVELATAYGANTLARFEVKNTQTNYVENATSGGDNRSISIKGTLPVILNVTPGEDIDLTETAEQLLKGPVVFFIERKDGRIFACGTQTGAEALTVDNQTGGTTGDLDGFTVTFTTEEEKFSRGYLLSGAALTDYAAALMPLV